MTENEMQHLHSQPTTENAISLENVRLGQLFYCNSSCRFFSTTLRKKITPENWVIASAKSVLLSRVLLLKKNGYFYPNRVPIPEYSGFVDTVRYFFYSGFLVSATPFFRVHSFVGYNYTNISGLATLLQV